MGITPGTSRLAQQTHQPSWVSSSEPVEALTPRQPSYPPKGGKSKGAGKGGKSKPGEKGKGVKVEMDRHVQVKAEASLRPVKTEGAAALTERELFVERRRSQQEIRDLSCKAICSIKRGLRQPGVQSHGKPFMPAEWDKVFKPALGSYIKFLLTRPDQFRVVEGSGPGLYTVENISGNKTVVAPSWEELASAKGKGKGKGKSKGKEKGKDKGKGKEGDETRGKGKGKAKADEKPYGKGFAARGKDQAPWREVSSSPNGGSKGVAQRLTPHPPLQPPPASLAAAVSQAFDETAEDEEVVEEEMLDAFEEGEFAEEAGLEWEQTDQADQEEYEEEDQDVEAEAEAEWARALEAETEEVIQPEDSEHGSLISALLSGGDGYSGQKRSLSALEESAKRRR